MMEAMEQSTACISRISDPHMKNPLYASAGSKVDSSKEFETIDVREIEPTKENTINILVIGETGVGKSTFINAFYNYFKFENLDVVEKEKPVVLIPCKITVTDENYELKEVKIGSDQNERYDLEESSTQDPRTYTFPICSGKKYVQFIDTPGIGRDSINCQKIMDYIAPLKMIHGILFLLKPNSSKITALFELCMKQILSRLDKSATKNLFFVFTNTRGTCYRPGETLPCLQRVLEDISKKSPYVSIPLSKENIFCLDNEAFRYLVAVASGHKFTERERKYFVESWNKSAEESWRMIFGIIGDGVNKLLEPHNVADTLCINDAKVLIDQLIQPMADITQLIYAEYKALQKQTELLARDDKDIDDMKKNLVIPIIDVEVAQLSQPVRVCTSSKCTQIDKVRDINKWQYIQRCHNPSVSRKNVHKRVGPPELMGRNPEDEKRNCKWCDCSFSKHMQIYYESIIVEKTVENANIRQNLMSREELKEEKQRLIQNMNQMKNELEIEHRTILQYMAKFAIFLQLNAINSYNDVYMQCIEFLIELERSNGEAADKNKISHLNECQREYDEAKKQFYNAMNMKDETVVTITPESIRQSVDDLFKLKHSGNKIKKFFRNQLGARNSEEENYAHTSRTNSEQGKKLRNFFVSHQTSTEKGITMKII